MKIAFATEDLKTVNAHFGWAKQIVIYDVDAESYEHHQTIEFDGNLAEDGNEDKLLPKIEAVKECAILYVTAIGGSAAARVVARKIHPIKVNGEPEIEELLEKFQKVLRGTPPPWLRKAILKDKATTLTSEN